MMKEDKKKINIPSEPPASTSGNMEEAPATQRKMPATEAASGNSDGPAGEEPEKKKKVSRWIKIPAGIIGSLILLVILIPVLLYIPPIQTAVKNLACNIVKKKTGMDINIDEFRLRFPLDIDLKGVRVIEASGDTMVRAKDAIVGVKILPLFALDVEVDKLRLEQGYYRMVSADSSMIMKIKAGLLQIKSDADINIKTSHIVLGKTLLKDGDISLYMNVWKQKPTPKDTTATPFVISSEDLQIENVRFAMSMLPTIDTLVLDLKNVNLQQGLIDLSTNNITAQSLKVKGGDVKYIAPTPEYVAAHPAPPADTTNVSAPMTIKAKDIEIANLGAIYAIKGAKPLPGFDPNYIEVSNVNIGLKDFYNQSANLRLPIVNISAKERSGLQITDGEGLIALNEAGLKIENVKLNTLYSRLSATADLPFALMALQPSAPVNAQVAGSIGMADISCFMPDLAPYVRPLAPNPLIAELEAKGTLDNVKVNKLDLTVPGVVSLDAHGYARNALDFKNMVADLTLKGEVRNPRPLEKIAGDALPVEIPTLSISGRATADHQNYMADFDLKTSEGDAVGLGHVGMTSERYDADLRINNLNLAHFVPNLGIGKLTATLKADGAGFNPTKAGAHTQIAGHISSVDYNGKPLHDITLDATLAASAFTLDLDSPNPDLNVTANLTGTIKPDDYCAQGTIKVYNADLQALGLSPTVNKGSADLHLDVTAHPEKWLYDANLDVTSVNWHLEDQDINLPNGATLAFVSEANDVHCNINADGTMLSFDSPEGLKNVVNGFSKAIDVALRQIKDVDLNVQEMGELMPKFALKGRINGGGLLRELLSSSGMAIDTISLDLTNDSLINGNIYAQGINTGSMMIDTVTLNLKERNQLMDYKIHMGNRPGPLGEFAQVNLNGYLGSNRLSAFLTQRNQVGKMGYRFGFTAALADSTVSVHFTPLNATIAYMPWTFNDDNHVDYNLHDSRVNANLMASSRESSLLIKTEPSEKGGDDLHVNLTNIHIQDFTSMLLTAPPIKGDVDGDVRLHYDGRTLSGSGDVKVNNLMYDKMLVGNLDLGLNAGLDFKGETLLAASLKVNDQPAMTLSTELTQGKSGLEPKTVDLALTRFPLSIANPFLGPDVARLSGVLNGKMNMTGSLSQPLLNGAIKCDSVAVYLPIMGSSLTFGQDSLAVDNSVLKFREFDIYGANKNPLTINGSVDASRLTDISFNLNANANDFQLMNNDRRARSDLYGKLFLNLTASVIGPMKHFDINANVNVLGNTDVFYSIPMGVQQLGNVTSTDDVVKFVNFSDTVTVAKPDSVQSSMAMRIRAGLTITPGAEVTVNLSSNGTDKLQLTPSGTVNYYQNFMGDMTLNGQIFLGNGMVRYNIPVLGDKTFTFNPQSSVSFNGDIMNPVLNIDATDEVKATVVNSSGNSNLANFLVGLKVTGSLSNPKVVFDLSTNDDLSLQNELQSMSADQRSTQAMNLLITGRYQGNGMKTSTGPMAENMLYGFLTSTLNQWAAKNIRGVDLSFGVDQYDKTVDGQNTSSTSYSYQVSKSLFSNRFKIVVGGNYSTDASADENFAQNLISDISFEYTLKQTNNLTMLVRLFRHVGYESILEGEVTETGVGFTMRRRLANLRRLFTVHWGKRKPRVPDNLPAPAPQDTIAPIREERKEMEK